MGPNPEILAVCAYVRSSPSIGHVDEIVSAYPPPATRFKVATTSGG